MRSRQRRQAAASVLSVRKEKPMKAIIIFNEVSKYDIRLSLDTLSRGIQETKESYKSLQELSGWTYSIDLNKDLAGFCKLIALAAEKKVPHRVQIVESKDLFYSWEPDEKS